MRLLKNPLADVVPDRGGLRMRVATLGVSIVATPLQVSLLELFAAPTTIDDACAKEPRAKRERAFLDDAAARGLLLPVDEHDRPLLPRTAAPEHTFLNAPHLRDAGDSNSDLTFAFFGVPWDKDVSGRAGARFGPSAVRAASAAWSYGVDALSRRPVGFFDLGQQRRVLQGVGFVDAGDVIALPGEARDVVFGRVSDVVREVYAVGAVPLIVGGDHSITRPVLTGVTDALRAQAKEAGRDPADDLLCLVHFDAHTDLGDALPDANGRLELHHGNVMTVVLAECARVHRIVQLGLRGVMKDLHHVTEDRVVAFGMDQFDDPSAAGVDAAVAAVLAVIPEEALCWFTVDIDVVDPAFAPSTGTPVPGGMTPRLLWRLIERLASARVCLGVDIVEVAEPLAPADGTAGIAATCLLRFCQAMVEAERAAAGALNAEPEPDDR